MRSIFSWLVLRGTTVTNSSPSMRAKYASDTAVDPRRLHEHRVGADPPFTRPYSNNDRASRCLSEPVGCGLVLQSTGRCPIREAGEDMQVGVSAAVGVGLGDADGIRTHASLLVPPCRVCRNIGLIRPISVVRRDYLRTPTSPTTSRSPTGHRLPDSSMSGSHLGLSSKPGVPGPMLVPCRGPAVTRLLGSGTAGRAAGRRPVPSPARRARAPGTARGRR